MKILTNKDYNSLINKHKDMCKHIQDLEKKHFKEQMALLDELEDLREIKETKLLLTKYSTIEELNNEFKRNYRKLYGSYGQSTAFP